MVTKGDSFETTVQSDPDDIDAGDSRVLEEGVYQIEVPVGMIAHVRMEAVADDNGCKSKIPDYGY